MINEDIKTQIRDAMKARDSVRLGTLKMLSSEIHNAEIDKGDSLTSEEEMRIVKSQAKKRKDAIEAYKKAKNKDKADLEDQELAILQEFLPEEMSDSEIEEIVSSAISEVGALNMQDMGKVMALAMNKIAGRADGKKVSSIVKDKLNG